MANGTKLTPGVIVWVIERDGEGNACELCRYVFLAKVGFAAILSPGIYGLDNVDELLYCYIEETRKEHELPMVVFPMSDCYIDRETAKEALLAEEG